jgi:hypothetical protein
MKYYEITVSKVVYRLVDEFESEAEARTFAITRRDLMRELEKDSRVEYFYELEEVGNE